MRCSLKSAHDLMVDIGEFKRGHNRRVFKTIFVGWLKSQGYEEDKQDEVDPVIKMFIGADNRNICTVASNNNSRAAGPGGQRALPH